MGEKNGDGASALKDQIRSWKQGEQIQCEGLRRMSAPISRSSWRNKDTGRQRDSSEGWRKAGNS